jgi:hypothetical protein
MVLLRCCFEGTDVFADAAAYRLCQPLLASARDIPILEAHYGPGGCLHTRTHVYYCTYLFGKTMEHVCLEVSFALYLPPVDGLVGSDVVAEAGSARRTSEWGNAPFDNVVNVLG